MARRNRIFRNRRSSRFSNFEGLEPRQLFAAHIVGNSTVYSTIQAAINAASPGATINVDAGTYNEELTINKTLTLQGAQAGVNAVGRTGKSESIINESPTAIVISANDVTLDGFVVQGSKANVGAAADAGIIMGPSIHGTHIVNNIIQNNVSGLYLSNNSDTDACVIQHNYFYNNTETGETWTLGWNGTRAIYTDGSVTGGLLTNVLIDSNSFYRDDTSDSEGYIALAAATGGKQFNITISNNIFAAKNKMSSKALNIFNTTNLSVIGNDISGENDNSSGGTRFEGNNHNVVIEYNNIHDNNGPGIEVDSAGVPGDSSNFVIDYNNFVNNSSTHNIGVIVNGIAYDGPAYVQNDYWGSSSGPSGLGTGTGEAVWGYGTTGHSTTPVGAPGGDVIFSPWSTTSINTTAVPAPAAPTGLSLVIASMSQINLSWTPQMSTATNQLIQRSTDGVNFTTIATVSPLISTYSDTGLTSQGYYYRVIATNWNGNSSPSNVATTIPGAPTSLMAAAVSTTQINLTWVDTAAGLETGFVIQRSTDGVNFSNVNTVATGITSYSDTNLLSGDTYTYRVIAMGTVGNSAPSSTATATTLSANMITTNLSSLTWTSAVAGYGTVQKNASINGNTITLRGKTYTTGIGTHAASTIVYNLAGNYTNFLSDVGIDDEEVTSSGPRGSVDFQVIGDGKVLFDSGKLTTGSAVVSIDVSVVGVQTLTLVATNGISGNIDYDHADWAGAQLLANPTAPMTPTNLAAVALSSSSIKFTWSPVGSNQTGFSIDRSIDGTNFSPLTSVPGTATSYTDTNLNAGVTYYYRVRATNSAGSSVNSAPVAATTLSSTMITTNLSSLNWTSATAGWGTVQKDTSISGNPITLHGVTYATGIGTHAASTIVYNLAGKYTNFISDVGLDDEEIGKGSGTVQFEVMGDGKVLFDSAVLTPSSPTVSINVSVAGVQTLTLIAANGIAGNIDYDHADWAGAKLLSNATVPNAPANLVATPVGQGIVKLTWAAASMGLTSYTINRSTDGTHFTTVDTGVDPNSTSWMDMSALSANTKYFYEILAIGPGGTSPVSNIASATTFTAGTATNVSDLTPMSATAGYGTVQTNASILGNPLTLNGTTYSSGIGTHASSTITYNVDGEFSTFFSDIGIDAEEDGKGEGSVDFQVWGDGKLLFDSGNLTNDQVVHITNLNVAGVQTLTLTATNGVPNSIDYDHADWAGAKLFA